MKKFVRYLFLIVLLIIAGVASLVVYAMITDYKPKEKELIFQSEISPDIPDSVEIFTVLTWNIGYAGLGENMDFFYDEGKQVYDSKENTLKNLAEISKFLKKHKDVDFIMIQEIDENSKRTYNINQLNELNKINKNHQSFYAKNYDVFFVPTPILKPFGKVDAGMALYSKPKPHIAIRHSLPGVYPFPKNLFMLDRCFISARYRLKNNKELVIVNTHNEAYDKGGIRKQQLDYLKKFIENEYNNGNYVIAGGDWNQCPPNFAPELSGYIMDNKNRLDIEPDLLPKNWKWIYDPKTPSNRRVMMPFDKTKTPTTVIDFFVVSPNIECISVQGTDLQFKNSDHNPVFATFKLIK